MRHKILLLTYISLLSFLNVGAKDILIENKTGASFRGSLDEVLPDTPSGPAIKVSRKSDNRTFRIPLNSLSEKTLINIVLLQNQADIIDDEPFGIEEETEDDVKKLKSQRVDGYKFVESAEATAEDIDLDIEFESVKKEDDTLTILGKVTNNSPHTVESCEIQIELRDSAKRLITRDEKMTDPWDIKSGQIATFRFWIFEDAIAKTRIREIIYRVKGDIE
jgi:hypothetical protein